MYTCSSSIEFTFGFIFIHFYTNLLYWVAGNLESVPGAQGRIRHGQGSIAHTNNNSHTMDNIEMQISLPHGLGEETREP